MAHPILVLSSCPNPEEARRIARTLVEEELAACIQIVPVLESIYRWQNQIESAPEHLLLIKTTHENFAALQARALQLHSYEVPELVALPITAGSPAYLSWLEGAVHA